MPAAAAAASLEYPVEFATSCNNTYDEVAENEALGTVCGTIEDVGIAIG